jgi:hypothetical protein
LSFKLKPCAILVSRIFTRLSRQLHGQCLNLVLNLDLCLILIQDLQLKLVHLSHCGAGIERSRLQPRVIPTPESRIVLFLNQILVPRQEQVKEFNWLVFLRKGNGHTYGAHHQRSQD